MTYLHPLFMLVVFGLVHRLRRQGLTVLALHPRSPEYAQRGTLLDSHRTLGWATVVLALAGGLGGMVAARVWLLVPTLFNHTYGHAQLGMVFVSLLLAIALVGTFIKRVVKEKIRQRFLDFHTGMVWLVVVVAALSLASGAWVLLRGPALHTG